jgi:hypothetical protein
MDEAIVKAQQEVQRKLGRCLLRLQQVEQLLKALVPHISLKGEANHLQSIQEKQIACAKTKTMGGLVSMLTGELLSPTLSDTELSDDESDNVGDAIETGWFKFSCQISMSVENYEQTRMALADLVEMRNGLVHHFLERFNIRVVSDCHKADAYLDECDAQINGQLANLQQWAKSMQKAGELSAEYLNSLEFEDAFVHGIMPDGIVDWPRTTIVECLRNAELACAQNGWTMLDSAIAHVRKSEPEQMPTKYHCKTWRQVLKKSEQFAIREDVNPLNGRGQVWYRSLENISVD